MFINANTYKSAMVLFAPPRPARPPPGPPPAPAAKSLTCLNYYTNEDITIPLDPQKTPQENAQKYFAKYNKQKRTFEALSELIQETADEIRYLESGSNSLDIALSEADLVQIKEE